MKGSLALFLLMITVGLFAEYDVVYRPSEFRNKLNDYDFSFVCIADEHSDHGREVKDAMRVLSLKGHFGKDLKDRFTFLFVPAQKERLSSVVKKYGYQGKPLFMLFEFDHEIMSSDLNGDYSTDRMKEFINETIADSLFELLDDVKEAKEAEHRQERYRPRARFHIGFGTGYYPGWGYYRGGSPYWWSKRYYRAPYRHFYSRGYRHGRKMKRF